MIGVNGLVPLNGLVGAEVQAERLRRAACKVADELRLDPTQTRLAKVSSLLHTFRGPELHCDITDVIEALSVQGVKPSPSLAEISRRDVLALRLEDGKSAPGARTDANTDVRLGRWRPGVASDLEPLGVHTELGPVEQGGIVWVDVDPRGSDDPSDDAVHKVTAELAPLCPGLTPIMVRDLLTPDLMPKTETYGDERTGVRTVSVPALVTREVPSGDADDFDGVDQQLIIQMVELAVGPGWIVTCWHRSRTLAGSGVAHEGPPLLREPFLSHVAHRWVNEPVEPENAGRPKDASDLATYLARSLIATYGASLRMLQRWVSSWEVEFYQTLGQDGGQEPGGGEIGRKRLKAATAEISSFLSIVGEFSRSVNAFKLAGDEMPNDTWFADPAGHSQADSKKEPASDQAKILLSSVDAASTKLTQLYDEIRADMDLVMIQNQAQQQAASERLQEYLGKVTGLVLVPTFVAGLYGANTALPGGGTWAGFDIMLLLMFLSALVSYLVIRRVNAGGGPSKRLLRAAFSRLKGRTLLARLNDFSTSWGRPAGVESVAASAGGRASSPHCPCMGNCLTP